MLVSVASMAVQKRLMPPSQAAFSTGSIQSQKKRSGHDPSGVPTGPNVDERLKAARERREEQQRMLASRELDRLEREQRARRYYEQQVQQRRKKLLEQRLREEGRRAAVEEKRKQRLKEEKDRHESAVRKSLEKSQRAKQDPGQSTRTRNPSKNVPRRSPLTAWEKNLLLRLLAPTWSHLARSRSAGCQPGGEVSFHSTTTTTIKTSSTPATIRTPHKIQQHAAPVHRRPPSSSRTNSSQQRSPRPPQVKQVRQPDVEKKKSTSRSDPRSSFLNTKIKSAAVTKSPVAPPSPERTSRRSVSRYSPQLELPSVPEEEAGSSRPVRTPAEGQQEETRNPPEAPRSNLPDYKTARTAGDGGPPRTPPPPRPPQVKSKHSSGISDPEEASRLLAEKRRETRLQREREDQERLRREEEEEEERRRREDLERRRTEERAQQRAEAQHLIEEKRRREEEEQKRAEEERAQAMREAVLLQKQREEEQAREKERAEQVRQEREEVAQREEEARHARKKRLEEIMRRTRRTDSPDPNSAAGRNPEQEVQPKESIHSVRNGTTEEAAKAPVATKTSQLGVKHEEDAVPAVAFKERRSLRNLTSLEDIQTHQRAEVI